MAQFIRLALALTMSILLALALHLPARGTSYRAYHPREIVAEAELVVFGKIIDIARPPADRNENLHGCSVALVRVERVFKGNVKAGSVVRFVYWSHYPSRNPKLEAFSSPDKFKVGEKLMLPLRRTDQARWKGYAVPKEAAKARHVCWAPRLVYERQIQSVEFRRVAEIWNEPEKHVDNPKLRDDAVYFLAVQQRLTQMALVQLLSSDDVDLQHAGCVAAEVMKTNAAFGHLTAIIEKHRGADAALEKAGFREREKLKAIQRLCKTARHALYVTPIDGTKDGPALLRFAICGKMELECSFTKHLLRRAGQARWHVRRGLLEARGAAMKANTLDVFHALDARAAYGPIKMYALTGDNLRHFDPLVCRYHTSWAQRVALERGSDIAGGHDPADEYSIIRRCFRFTYQPVELDAKGKDWKTACALFRKKAKEQWAVTEKKGPSFAELPERLKDVAKWEVHRVGAGAFVVLNETQQKNISALILRSADPKAAGLDAQAEAVWFVDLYRHRNSDYMFGQLWVAADGTFGFGWLPDRAWGRSAALRDFLSKLPQRDLQPK